MKKILTGFGLFLLTISSSQAFERKSMECFPNEKGPSNSQSVIIGYYHDELEDKLQCRKWFYEAKNCQGSIVKASQITPCDQEPAEFSKVLTQLN